MTTDKRTRSRNRGRATQSSPVLTPERAGGHVAQRNAEAHGLTLSEARQKGAGIKAAKAAQKENQALAMQAEKNFATFKKNNPAAAAQGQSTQVKRALNAVGAKVTANLQGGPTRLSDEDAEQAAEKSRSRLAGDRAGLAQAGRDLNGEGGQSPGPLQGKAVQATVQGLVDLGKPIRANGGERTALDAMLQCGPRAGVNAGLPGKVARPLPKAAANAPASRLEQDAARNERAARRRSEKDKQAALGSAGPGMDPAAGGTGEGPGPRVRPSKESTTQAPGDGDAVMTDAGTGERLVPLSPAGNDEAAGGFKTAQDSDHPFGTEEDLLMSDENYARNLQEQEMAGIDNDDGMLSEDSDPSVAIDDNHTDICDEYQVAVGRLVGRERDQLRESMTGSWMQGREPKTRPDGVHKIATEAMTHLEDIAFLVNGGSGDIAADRESVSVIVSGDGERKQLGSSGSAGMTMALPYLGDHKCPQRYRYLKEAVNDAIFALSATGKSTKVAAAATARAAMHGMAIAYLVPQTDEDGIITCDDVHQAALQGRVHPRIAETMSLWARNVGNMILKQLIAAAPKPDLPTDADDKEQPREAGRGAASKRSTSKQGRASKDKSRRQKRRERRRYYDSSSSSSSDSDSRSSSDDDSRSKKFMSDRRLYAAETMEAAVSIFKALLDAAPAAQRSTVYDWEPRKDNESPILIAVANSQQCQNMYGLLAYVGKVAAADFIKAMKFPDRGADLPHMKSDMKRFLTHVKDVGALATLQADDDYQNFCGLIDDAVFDDVMKKLRTTKAMTIHECFKTAAQLVRPLGHRAYTRCQQNLNPTRLMLGQWFAAMFAMQDRSYPGMPAGSVGLHKAHVDDACKLADKILAKWKIKKRREDGLQLHPAIMANVHELEGHTPNQILAEACYALNRGEIKHDLRFVDNPEDYDYYKITDDERKQGKTFGVFPEYFIRVLEKTMERLAAPAEKYFERLVLPGHQPPVVNEDKPESIRPAILQLKKDFASYMTTEEQAELRALGPPRESHRRTEAHDGFPFYVLPDLYADAPQPHHRNPAIWVQQKPDGQFLFKGQTLAVTDPKAVAVARYPGRHAACREWAKMQTPTQTFDWLSKANAAQKAPEDGAATRPLTAGGNETAGGPSKRQTRRERQKKKRAEVAAAKGAAGAGPSGSGSGGPAAAAGGGVGGGGATGYYANDASSKGGGQNAGATSAKGGGKGGGKNGKGDGKRGKGKGDGKGRPGEGGKGKLGANGKPRPFQNRAIMMGGKDPSQSKYATMQKECEDPGFVVREGYCAMCLVKRPICPNERYVTKDMTWEEFSAQIVDKCANTKEIIDYFGIKPFDPKVYADRCGPRLDIAYNPKFKKSMHTMRCFYDFAHRHALPRTAA